ncbi:ISPg1 transposase [Neisseria meningitidis]|uniref:ISPg1 transposase n=1 Tax=Neisseria meningitidis TaxID=487 RepID=X5EQB2_NEIME|nr:ISPg1 transposase [Neisseria meningitidis]
MLEGLPKGTTVYADKGYDSAENRQHLEEHQLQDGIMRKACRNRPLTEAQTKRNRRPLQNSPKSPKFPPSHLGDFP